MKLDRPYHIVWQGARRICRESFPNEDAMNERYRTLERILTREAAATLHREYPKETQRGLCHSSINGTLFPSEEVHRDEAED